MTESLPPRPSGSPPAGSFRPDGRCTLLATDISEYGRHRDQIAARRQHYRVLESCLQEAGIELGECYLEDRGDGAIVAIPAHHDPLRVIRAFLDKLPLQLRAYNLGAVKSERIRLRVAVHIGAAHHDGHGLPDGDVVRVFRLIETPRLKNEFRESAASVAFVTSTDVYDRVIKPAAKDIDPDDFQQIPVRLKETDTTAWMQLRPRAPRLPSADSCPYPGLEAFGLDYAEWFFGREGAVAELLDRLEKQLQKPGPLIVTGASGVGKSSLLRAGLLHSLKSGELRVPGSPDWTRLLFTPTADPLYELSERLADAGISAPNIEEEEKEQEGQEERQEGQEERQGRLGQAREPPENSGDAADRPVIVIDQFEDTFTLCSDERQRHLFIRKLCALATTGGDGVGPALVVLGLRSEFFDRCAAYPELQDALRAPVPLAPMTRDELSKAITKPAEKVGFDIEAGLVGVLLGDLEIPDEPGGAALASGALPLLAHALRATWQEGGGHGLTVRSYGDIGRVKQAIAQTAGQVYDQLDADQRQTARRLLLRMINISNDGQTRRRVDRTWLVEESPDPEKANAVLETLADHRVVTLEATTAELVHDVLLREWRLLREWIDNDRAGLILEQRLTEDADTWHRESRDKSGLYRGARLAGALAWAEGHDADLTQRARDFLDASTAAERWERETERRRARRLKVYNIALACVTAVAVIATFIAGLSQRTAAGQRNEAQSSQVAGEAATLLQTRSELALLLSAEAFRIHRTTDARDGLLSTQADYYAARLPTGAGPANDVAFDPAGKTIAVAARDGVDEWDAETRQHLTTVLKGNGASYGVAFSPDGHLLAIAKDDGGVALWSDRDRQARVLPPGPQDRGPANAVAFSPDGHTLADAGNDGVVRLWDTRDRGLIAEFSDNLGPVEAVAFSPDGRTVAGAGADTAVAVWDIPSRTLRKRIKGHVGPVRSVAFSPDGQLIASGGDDGSVRLWDADTLTPLGNLIGHIGAVRSVTFSPDSRVLASGGNDASIRLWDVRSRGLLTSLTGPAGPIAKVTFSPHGGMLASANEDAGVGFWRLGGLGGGPNLVHAVTVRPDGPPLLATAGADGAIRLWNVRTGRRIAILRRDGAREPDRTVDDLEFSHDGRLLAAARGRDVTVWDVSAGAEPAVRRRAELRSSDATAVTAVAFSPDGRIVAAAADRTLTLWDIRTRRRRTTTPHPSHINVIAFSPDGRTIATGNNDQTVSLTPIKDATSDISPGTSSDCSGHLGPIRALAFSPRGDLLASGSTDHTVNLWSLGPCRLVHTFTGQTQTVSAVAFSPDGRRLAGAGEDDLINVWDLQPPGQAITDTPIAALHDRSGIATLIFGATGDELISVDPDGRPVVWDTDPDRVIDRLCRTRPPLPPDWGRYVAKGAPPPCP